MKYLRSDRTLPIDLLQCEGFNIQFQSYKYLYMMNPLGISVLFVICSVLLSFVKDIIFSDPEPAKSIIKFSKVLQMSNNKLQKSNQHYKSLYEAYHRHQVFDPQKTSKLIPNRHQFNQSVLTESLNNEQSSFMCGPDFLVLVFSGVSINNLDRVQWINTFHIYKLPLMAKIKQLNINGKIILPIQCKRNNAQYDIQYEIGIISKEEFHLIKIYEESAFISYSKSREPNKNSDGIDKFDFFGTWFVYCSEDRPWIIRLENIMFQDETVQINLLREENGTKNNIPQQINVRYLLLGQSEELYLGVIYNHHLYGDSTKNISLLTYLIKDKTATQLRKRTLDNNAPSHDHIISQCRIYTNQETFKYDLSCLITENRQNIMKYLNYDDVFKPAKKSYGNQDKQDEQKQELQERNWMEDYLYSFIDEDDGADHYDYLSQDAETQSQKNNSYFSISLTLTNPTHEVKKIVKHSAPNPIIYYEKEQKHFLFSIAFPMNLQQSKMESVPYLLFELTPPNSQNDEVSLRDIKWVNNENFVVVLWTTGIEVYQYSCTNLPDMQGEGIAMSVIIPFIELFATVFCLLRIIWNND